MSIEEQRRKAFEAWAWREFCIGDVVARSRFCHESYRDEDVEGAWQAWNAAMDSVVIELPIIEPASTPSLSAIKVAFRRAIEAAGLKVKP